jgi:hypothetical protein
MDLTEIFPDPRTGNFRLLGTEGGLWVPPTVEVRWLPPIRSVRRHALGERVHEDTEPTPFVVYPVPEPWLFEADVLVGRLYASKSVLNRAQVWLPFPWERVSWGPLMAHCALELLTPLGWQSKPVTDAKKMLQEFLALARDHPDDPQTIEDVKAFTQRWGPAWLCRNPEHVDCHWSVLGGDQFPSPCLWAPVEEIREIVRKAWEATIVVEVANALRRHLPIPEKATSHLPCVTGPWLHQSALEDLAQYPDFWPRVLEYALNRHLSAHSTGRWGARLWVSWEQQAPQLQLWSSLGAIPALWLAIAQAVTDAHAFLRCDGCQQWYFRTKRIPRRGEQNYCDACRRGGKPQRNYWRRQHRGKAGQPTSQA